MSILFPVSLKAEGDGDKAGLRCGRVYFFSGGGLPALELNFLGLDVCSHRDDFDFHRGAGGKHGEAPFDDLTAFRLDLNENGAVVVHRYRGFCDPRF